MVKSQSLLHERRLFLKSIVETFQEVSFKFTLHCHTSLSLHNAMISESCVPMAPLYVVDLGECVDHESDFVFLSTSRDSFLVILRPPEMFLEFRIHDLHEAFRNLGIQGFRTRPGAAEYRSDVVQILH